MPDSHAAGLAALARLFRRGMILSDDYRAGAEYARLAECRLRRFYRPAYDAALKALMRHGVPTFCVDAVVLDGQMPGTHAMRCGLQDGLHGLATPFRAEGLL